jgi:uridylate kinase
MKSRVLLKLSGEALSGEGKTGFDVDALNFIGEELTSVRNTHELAIVVGGGNIIRGRELKESKIDDGGVTADYAGMVATVINAALLGNFLRANFGLDIRVMSKIWIKELSESYIVERAKRHLEKERVLIFAGGLGEPGFSTDTAMVLRAHEIKADIVLKGTKVDGVYDGNPHEGTTTQFLEKVCYADYLSRDLKIVDSTSVTKARDYGMEIRVFNFFVKGNLKRVLTDQDIGSVIY